LWKSDEHGRRLFFFLHRHSFSGLEQESPGEEQKEKNRIAFFGRSMFVASLFASHPINVETVAWVAERKSLLATLFFFLAIGAYGAYVRRKSVPRYLWSACSLTILVEFFSASRFLSFFS